MNEIGYFLFVLFGGIFIPALIRILWVRPKDCLTVVLGCTFLILGMKQNPFARRTMQRLLSKNES